MTSDIRHILDFWFGDLDAAGMAAPDKHSLWFDSTQATDAQCQEHFEALVVRAKHGELQHWASSNDGLMALVILLDQITRNIHRGTPAAFSGDPAALALAQQCIDAERHLNLPAIHQVFLFLPLEHAEDITIQRRCVDLFRALERRNTHPSIPGFTRFAVAHRDVVEQFGRFPHRNAILDRVSTPAEVEHMQRHSGF